LSALNPHEIWCRPIFIVLISVVGRDSVVGTVTRYGLDGPAIESWWRPTSYTMGSGCFPEAKRPRRGVERTSPSSTEVKERVELRLYSPMGLRGLC